MTAPYRIDVRVESGAGGVPHMVTDAAAALVADLRGRRQPFTVEVVEVLASNIAGGERVLDAWTDDE